MVKRLRPTELKARATRKAKARLDPTDEDVRAVLRALEKIDAVREEVEWQQDELWAACCRSPKLRQAWKRFTEEGGVTAADFRAFIRGGKLRGCPVQKEHLRLVVNNTEKRQGRGSIPSARTGPNAA